MEKKIILLFFFLVIFFYIASSTKTSYQIRKKLSSGKSLINSKLIRNFESTEEEWIVTYNSKLNTPTFISKISSTNSKIEKRNSNLFTSSISSLSNELHQKAMSFLNQNKVSLGIEDMNFSGNRNDLKPVLDKKMIISEIENENENNLNLEIRKDPHFPNDNLHVSYDQYFSNYFDNSNFENNDVQVLGGHLKFHFSRSENNGEFEINSINGLVIPKKFNQFEKPSLPSISKLDATKIALEQTSNQHSSFINFQVISKNDAIITDNIEEINSNVKLMVIQNNLLNPNFDDGKQNLVYEVLVSNIFENELKSKPIRNLVYVNAYTGNIEQIIPTIPDALHRTIWINDRNNSDTSQNVFWNEGDSFPTEFKEANNLIEYSRHVYDFYLNLGFDSYDNKGSPFWSIFNFTDAEICPNAFFTGSLATFCNGTACPDVIGHEFTHGLTENTHSLVYLYQSGALNEAYSDIFGETIEYLHNEVSPQPKRNGSCSIYSGPNGSNGTEDSTKWLCGVECSAFGGPIRDMYSPSCFGHPDKVSSEFYYCNDTDGGGVHTNSGVPNHAFALLVDGGDFNGYTIQSIGLTKAIHIYWRAMTVYQFPFTQFSDHADSLEKSCSDLKNVNNLTDLITGRVDTSVVITDIDCEQISKVILAVEFRNIIPCNFTTLLEKTPPEGIQLCSSTSILRTIFNDNFEKNDTWTLTNQGVYPEYIPRNWIYVNTLQRFPSIKNNTNPFGYFAEDPINLGDCTPGSDDQSGVVQITSPLINFNFSSNTKLYIAFDHIVAVETGYDGGNLKIKINDQNFTLIPASAFTFNSYTGQLYTSNISSNPLSGEDGFSGIDQGAKSLGSEGWFSSIISIPIEFFPTDRTEHSINLRFEFGTDGCGGAIGYLFSNVRIYVCDGESLDDPNTIQKDTSSSSSLYNLIYVAFILQVFILMAIF